MVFYERVPVVRINARNYCDVDWRGDLADIVHLTTGTRCYATKGERTRER